MSYELTKSDWVFAALVAAFVALLYVLDAHHEAHKFDRFKIENRTTNLYINVFDPPRGPIVFQGRSHDR